MVDKLRKGIGDALRLTRGGQLAEATAAIQQALGSPAPSVPRRNGGAAMTDVIDATFSRVNEPASPPQDAPKRSARARTARTPAGASSPGAPRAKRLDPTLRAGASLPFDVPVQARPVTAVQPSERFVERSYTNRSGTRTYKLYIPSGYRGEAVPLVIMLHGCTQTPDDFAAGTRMNTLAEDGTFLVAYPAQSSKANGSKCWNWFKASEQQRDTGEPSLIAGITSQIMREYSVDAERVYVAGLSAGGAMAVIMGTAYPDLYAAAGVHSGLPYGAATDLPSALTAMHRGGSAGSAQGVGTHDRGVPMIVFHGDRDTTVHPRNSEQILLQAANKMPTTGPSGREAAPSKVRTRQGQVSHGHGYQCTTYHDAANRVVLEQWTIHGAAHAWSGGSSMGTYTDPKGPDASAEMVRFFWEHPHPRLG